LDPIDRGSKLLCRQLSKDDVCKFLAVSGVLPAILILLLKNLFKARRLGLVVDDVDVFI